MCSHAEHGNKSLTERQYTLSTPLRIPICNFHFLIFNCQSPLLIWTPSLALRAGE